MQQCKIDFNMISIYFLREDTFWVASLNDIISETYKMNNQNIAFSQQRVVMCHCRELFGSDSITHTFLTQSGS
jgi:hypothetical protein